MERIEDTLIQEGSYTLEVRFPIGQLEIGNIALEMAIRNFNNTCNSLLKRIPHSKCKILNNDLEMSIQKRKSIWELIKSFFPNRKTRGFITAVGGMDSDDRTRIDSNLDKLRKNEETLRNSLKHQTNTMDAMYKFVDVSVKHLDDRLKTINDQFNSLKSVVAEDLNFANSLRSTMEMETQLIEIGFRIQSLISELKDQQSLILHILMGSTNEISALIQLIEPTELIEMLVEANGKLSNGQTFPKKSNNEMVPGILNLMKVSYSTLNNKMLLIKLSLPIVRDVTFITHKGIFIPEINGTIISSINLEEDIIIEEIGSNWGYTMSSTEFAKCAKFSNRRICDIKTPEKELTSENKCLLNMRFKNITDRCSITILQIKNDVWFATEEPNVWEYATPSEIKINIFHGLNHSNIIIRGSGKIRLTPEMRIETDHVRILYSNISVTDKFTVVNNIQQNIWNFTVDSKKLEQIPTLAANMSIVSFYDRKKLFELGVDIADLKDDKTFLENMIYSPLSSHWTITSIALGALIMIAALIIYFTYCFKGKIICGKGSVETPQISKFREMEIIHHIPFQTEELTHVKEIIDNPNHREHKIKRRETTRDNDNYLEPIYADAENITQNKKHKEEKKQIQSRNNDIIIKAEIHNQKKENGTITENLTKNDDQIKMKQINLKNIQKKLKANIKIR